MKPTEIAKRIRTRPLDPKRQAAFAERHMERLGGAAVLLMTSIGHRTGLFDALSAAGPVTSAELAARAGLDERYVREWLGAMVSGGVVELDAQTRRYELPPEHAAWLTRWAPQNLATSAQWIAVLGAVESRIVDCFVHGGGVAYDEYERFHEVMAEESAQSVVAALDEHILPLDPELVPRLTQGMDVLDVGCGSGRALLHMAKRYPSSRFLGVDLSGDALAAASREAARQGLDNLHFEVLDVGARELPRRFDLVTAFDAIHDQARPDLVLERIARALDPGGVFLMQEIRAETAHEHNTANPLAPFLYTISCMHCMSVSLSQGGMGLGAAWGRDLCAEYLERAGFRRIVRHELEHDPMNDYYIARR